MGSSFFSISSMIELIHEKGLNSKREGRQQDCLDCSVVNQLKTLNGTSSGRKAIVNCSSGDHRKRLRAEAARIPSKSNRQMFVRRSPQKTHDRSRKDSQQKLAHK